MRKVQEDRLWLGVYGISAAVVLAFVLQLLVATWLAHHGGQ